MHIKHDWTKKRSLCHHFTIPLSITANSSSVFDNGDLLSEALSFHWDGLYNTVFTFSLFTISFIYRTIYSLCEDFGLKHTMESSEGKNKTDESGWSRRAGRRDWRAGSV